MVGARFIPVVRTFTPIVAGVARMRYRTFLAYNLVGAAIWGIGITTLGYFLGEIQLIKNNLDYAAIVILILSLVPIALEYRRHRCDPVGASG